MRHAIRLSQRILRSTKPFTQTGAGRPADIPPLMKQGISTHASTGAKALTSSFQSSQHQNRGYIQAGSMAGLVGALGCFASVTHQERAKAGTINKGEFDYIFPIDRGWFWDGQFWTYKQYTHFNSNMDALSNGQAPHKMKKILLSTLQMLPLQKTAYLDLTEEQSKLMRQMIDRLVKTLSALDINAINTNDQYHIRVILEQYKKVGKHLLDVQKGAKMLSNVEQAIIETDQSICDNIASSIQAVVENPHYSGCTGAALGGITAVIVCGPGGIVAAPTYLVYSTGIGYTAGYAASYTYLLTCKPDSLAKFQKECPAQKRFGEAVIALTVGHTIIQGTSWLFSDLKIAQIATALAITEKEAQTMVDALSQLQKGWTKDVLTDFAKSSLGHYAKNYPSTVAAIRKAVNASMSIDDEQKVALHHANQLTGQPKTPSPAA